jgi:hypothetical protein
MKHFLLFTFISVFSMTTMASIASEGPKADTFKLGAVVGNVALSNSGTGISKNAIGLGGVLGYSIEDELSFEMTYLKSSHDDLAHTDLSLGVEYYFNSYEPFYYGLTGGVSFTKNKLDKTSPTVAKGDDTAFGLFVGIGADVFTKRGMILGLQARYYDMFGSDKDIGGTKYNLVDNYYTILARVLFQF